MRAEELWFVLRLAMLGWVVSLVGCHSTLKLESVQYGPTVPENRLLSDSYTLAYITTDYKDEHGNEYITRSESGKYGEGYIGSFRGLAVHVRAKGLEGEMDHTGCTLPLLSMADPNEPLPQEPWVAVIKRGSCKFEVKVQNAWRSNAIAVLIYNDRDTTVLDKMNLSTNNARNISAVFTYKWKGELITQLIENGKRVMIDVIKGRTFERVTNNINETSVISVLTYIIVVCLSLIPLVWLIYCYVQRRLRG